MQRDGTPRTPAGVGHGASGQHPGVVDAVLERATGDVARGSDGCYNRRLRVLVAHDSDPVRPVLRTTVCYKPTSRMLRAAATVAMADDGRGANNFATATRPRCCKPMPQMLQPTTTVATTSNGAATGTARAASGEGAELQPARCGAAIGYGVCYDQQWRELQPSKTRAASDNGAKLQPVRYGAAIGYGSCGNGGSCKWRWMELQTGRTGGRPCYIRRNRLARMLDPAGHNAAGGTASCYERLVVKRHGGEQQGGTGGSAASGGTTSFKRGAATAGGSNRLHLVHAMRRQEQTGKASREGMRGACSSTRLGEPDHVARPPILRGIGRPAPSADLLLLLFSESHNRVQVNA